MIVGVWLMAVMLWQQDEYDYYYNCILTDIYVKMLKCLIGTKRLSDYI